MLYLVSANTWNTMLGNCWLLILNVITFHIQPLKNIITSKHNRENYSKGLSYDYTIQTIKLTRWASDGDKHTFIALRYVKSLLTQLRFKSVFSKHTGFPDSMAHISLTWQRSLLIFLLLHLHP